MRIDEKTSGEEKPKVKVKMIRVKAPINDSEVDEEQDEPFETIEEQGYKIGYKGNQCEIDLTEALKRIDEEESSLGKLQILC